MNKEEIQKKIDSLKTNFKNDIKELEEQLESSEPWSPPAGKYYVYGSGVVGPSNLGSQKFGSEHLTRQSAVERAKLQKLQNWLFQLAEELNEGWEVDFDQGASKNTQQKWIVLYNSSTNDMIVSQSSNDYRDGSQSYHNQILGVSYFKDYETALKAVKIIDEWDWI